MRGEVLPWPRTPPQTAWRQPARAAGSGKHGTHKGTSSNSFTSLVAELPEDKSSDYKADLGQTAKMPGERRNQPLRGRSQAEGRRRAAVSDPARGGFESTGHHRPLETGGLSGDPELQGTLPQPGQHRPGPPLHAQTVATSSARQHLSHQKDGVAGCGHLLPSSAKSPRLGLSPLGSWGLQAGSGALGLHHAPL